MFNVNFLEKKLKDLKAGTYYKELNGKAYEIVVKEENNEEKNIKVYHNNLLIINFIYYKNGKIKEEGNTMKDGNEKYTLENIIERMINLSEGYAKIDNMSILVKEPKVIDSNSSTAFTVEVDDDNYSYTFIIPFTNEYYINIKPKNNDFTFYTKKDRMTKEVNNRSLMFTANNQNYSLTKDKLINLYEAKTYRIRNNSLVYKIDGKYSIGYNFDNDKVYIYSKKNDAINNDLDKDYNKISYTKNLGKLNNVCNNLMNVLKTKAKENIEDEKLNKLIDDINIPKVDINFDAYYDEINLMAVLYKTYNIYLNILDDEKVINSIYKLVTNANITLVDKKINDFKDDVNYKNLKDLNTFYELKKQIKEIIKLKKKEDKTKKKILKNTDIEH